MLGLVFRINYTGHAALAYSEEGMMMKSAKNLEGGSMTHLNPFAGK
jgi:hypothetical protein